MQSITFQLSAADLIDARRYVYNRLPQTRVVRLVPFALIAGYLLRGSYLALHGDDSGFIDQFSLFAVGAALIAWTYVSDRWLLPRSARRQLAGSRALQDKVTMSWDQDRITLASEHGQSQWPWQDLDRWQESRLSLLLWQSDRTYHLLPKRVFTDGQISEVRGFLRKALGEPNKRRT